MNNEFIISKEVQKEINMVKRAGIQTEYYPKLVEILIELKYNLKQEIAINRQKDNKPLEWQEYNAYCERAKYYAKELLGIE